MVCAPVRSIIPSLKLSDDLSVHAHKPYSISHIAQRKRTCEYFKMVLLLLLGRLEVSEPI